MPVISLEGDKPDVSFENSPKEADAAAYGTQSSFYHMPCGEYVVYIDRTSWNQKMPLGLQVDDELFVEGIQRFSLMYDWNVQNPDCKVELFDQVVSVNGVTSQKETMLKELQRKGCITEVTLKKSKALSTRRQATDVAIMRRRDILCRLFSSHALDDQWRGV